MLNPVYWLTKMVWRMRATAIVFEFIADLLNSENIEIINGLDRLLLLHGVIGVDERRNDFNCLLCHDWSDTQIIIKLVIVQVLLHSKVKPQLATCAVYMYSVQKSKCIKSTSSVHLVQCTVDWVLSVLYDSWTCAPPNECLGISTEMPVAAVAR